MGDFADVLIELRQKAGLTQEALARKADLSVNTIAKLEQGGVDPSWSTVRKLARALGVRCSAFEVEDPFASGTNAPPEPPKSPRGRPRRK